MKQVDLRLTWLVARRELLDQMRDWRILVPMVILVLFFPYLMNYAAFQTVDFINQYGADLVAERVVPFFLMVVGFFPVTVSLIVALEAFVGEKERGTIEPMLSSPLADWHIYIGKLMAGTLVPLAASYLSMGLYLIGLLLQRLPFPPFDVLAQMFLLTAVQATLMVNAAIVISTQSTSVRAANLLASFVVIPVALLIQAESALIFWGDNDVLWLAILAVAVVNVLVVRLGLAHFQREGLIGREIDMLNLGWVAQFFWKSFSGSAQAPASLRWLAAPKSGPVGQAILDDLRAIPAWYVGQVFPILGRMRAALVIMLGIGLVAIVATFAFIQVQFGDLVITDEKVAEVMEQVRPMLLDQQQGIPEIELSASWLFFNNLRAELLLSFFGMFSFGVVGILIYGLNFALIGGVLAVVDLIGLSAPEIFLYGVLPHGIFELPSIILVAAVVLYMGARVVTPNPEESISEVIIHTMADWLKIVLGLAIPLLLIAAVIEANITPVLLYNFIQQLALTGS